MRHLLRKLMLKIAVKSLRSANKILMQYARCALSWLGTPYTSSPRLRTYFGSLPRIFVSSQDTILLRYRQKAKKIIAGYLLLTMFIPVRYCDLNRIHMYTMLSCLFSCLMVMKGAIFSFGIIWKTLGYLYQHFFPKKNMAFWDNGEKLFFKKKVENIFSFLAWGQNDI